MTHRDPHAADKAEALDEILQYSAQFIGCRCNEDDCDPGDCWPCRMSRIGGIAEAALSAEPPQPTVEPVRGDYVEPIEECLRTLDYQRDLAIVFMVAKGSKDYDETIGNRIERVQELILQLFRRNRCLEAIQQGHIGKTLTQSPALDMDKIVEALETGKHYTKLLMARNEWEDISNVHHERALAAIDAAIEAVKQVRGKDVRTEGDKTPAE